MSEELHAKVLSFLLKEFARLEGRQCTRVDLTSSAPGSRGSSIGVWDRAEYPDPATSPFQGQGNIEALTTDVLRKAEEYADSFGSGQHRFVIVTHQVLGGTGRCAFRVAVASEDDPDVGGNDAPTVTGQLAQQMRHTELHMKMNAQTQMGTLGILREMLADLSAENARLRRERSDHLTELEASRSRETEREMAALEAVGADRRKDMLVGKLAQLAPVVAARFLEAKGGSSSAPTGLSILITELAESLSQEQAMGILNVLSVEQKILFMEAFRAAKAAKDKAEAAAGQAQAQAPSSGTATAAPQANGVHP